MFFTSNTFQIRSFNLKNHPLLMKPFSSRNTSIAHPLRWTRLRLFWEVSRLLFVETPRLLCCILARKTEQFWRRKTAILWHRHHKKVALNKQPNMFWWDQSKKHIVMLLAWKKTWTPCFNCDNFFKSGGQQVPAMIVGSNVGLSSTWYADAKKCMVPQKESPLPLLVRKTPVEHHKEWYSQAPHVHCKAMPTAMPW